MRHAVVSTMTASLAHRGPDDAGVVTIGNATLGHRRLAVLDPAKGHQPMASPDARFHIVFNGAIYNFRELRSQLSSTGFSFRTDGDTEVLLAAYAQWGAGCVERLRGMFAFAIWDAHEAVLFLARDPFGIKPLYYHHDGGRLLFSSEVRAFRNAGVFPLEIDPSAVADYLGWLAVPAPRTIYRRVRSLRAGESLTFRNAQIEVKSEWNFARAPAHEAAPAGFPMSSNRVCRTQTEFNAELRVRLEETVRAHVIADVPVGAFLSGGLDSAVVAALMARELGTPLKTFSIGFNEAEFDETNLAVATAKHLGAHHSARVLTGMDVASELPTILAAMDQPTGDGINTYYASQAARAGGVVVALSGLGGDELFGGYPSFHDIPRMARWLPLWRATPPTLRRMVLRRLNAGDTRARKMADILDQAGSIGEICALQRRVFSASQMDELLSPDVRTAIGPPPIRHPELAALTTALSQANPFETISAWELRTYMADVLLRDSDVMSMRHGLELRVPFVDRPLIEWLRQQPARFKYDRTHPKSALAACAADLLPPELAGRAKRGFTLPFARWMRSDLKPFLDATFSDGSLEASGLFAPKPVQRYWQQYLSADDTRQWSRVWSLAVLIDFVNRQTGSISQETQGSTSAIQVSSVPASTNSSSKNPRRRTLLLAPELFSAEGGIPRMLQIYLKALCDLATPPQSVQFLSLNDRLIDTQDLRRSSNERLTEWRVCNRQKTRFVRAALSMSREADCLICGHVAQLPVAWLATLLNPRLRYYLVAHGIEVWRPFTFAERLALRRAARIFCVSEFTRRELLRHGRLPHDRTFVLPNALDPSFVISENGDRRSRSPDILTVTRLANAHRYKGVEHLIKAMPAIRAAIPAATLRVIGRGDDMLRLQQLRDKLGLQTAVQFLGYVDDARISEEMRRCALFALPSSQEGFGLVFVEAMAHGQPCIGARAGGIPEIITPDTGLLVEPGDVPAIAAACVAALHRGWDVAALHHRAQAFSYTRFKQRLADALDH